MFAFKKKKKTYSLGLIIFFFAVSSGLADYLGTLIMFAGIFCDLNVVVKITK